MGSILYGQNGPRNGGGSANNKIFENLSAEDLERRAKTGPTIISFELKSLAAIKRRQAVLQTLLKEAEELSDWDRYTDLDTEQRFLEEEKFQFVDLIRSKTGRRKNKVEKSERKSRQEILEERIRELERWIATKEYSKY